LLKFLLSNGFEVDARDDRGGTLLHSAASSGRREIAGYLILRGAEINVQDCDGKTPFQRAILDKHPEVIEELLKANADIGNIVAEEWRKAHGKDVRDIMELREESDGSKSVDFDSTFPTAEDLSLAVVIDEKRLLYVIFPVSQQPTDIYKFV
jgi:hypothetical protein